MTDRLKSKIIASCGATILVTCFLAGFLIRLEKVPAMWWDEGWTVAVAKNWVERGFYGMLRSGNPAPPGLAASFPIVYPVAWSFRFFGIGIWQARLPMVIISMGTIAVLFMFVRSLMGRKVAFAALGVLLITPGYGDLHVLIMGRQVIGEMAALLFLLAGYFFFMQALNKRPLWILASILSWGIALDAKAQVLPFFAFSLTVPLALALWKRRFHVCRMLGFGLLGSIVAAQAMLKLNSISLLGRTMPQEPLQGIYEVSGWVMIPKVRTTALAFVAFYGLLTICGLAYGIWKSVSRRPNQEIVDSGLVLRICLLALASGWIAWYLFFGSWWLRYFFPPVFIGSIFVAEWVCDLISYMKPPIGPRMAAASLLAGSMIGILIWLTINSLCNFYVTRADSSVLDVAHYLNTKTRADALIETYESELFFLLNRRYHYPPDQVHVELNRRTLSARSVFVDYDPLAASPDYLVIGRFGKMWGLYDDVVKKGHFTPLVVFGNYTILKSGNRQ